MGKDDIQDGLLGGIGPAGGKILAILNAQVVCSFLNFAPNTTQVLEA